MNSTNTTVIPTSSSLNYSTMSSTMSTTLATTMTSTDNTSHFNVSGNSTLQPQATLPCFYRPDTDQEKLFKLIAYCVILVLSLFGNLLIITVILANKKMRRPTNYFILNMAISDLAVPFLFIPTFISQLELGSYGWAVDGDIGLVLCKMTNLLKDVSIAVSIASLILITVDRFYAVVFPMKHYIMSGFVCKICIALSWFFGLLLHGIYLYTTIIFRAPDGRLVCINSWARLGSSGIEIQKKYFPTLFFLLCLLPFMGMTTAYTIIYVNLKRHSLPLGDSLTERQKKQRALKERKVLLMALAIVAAFAVLWAPYNATSFLFLFVYTDKIPSGCWLKTLTFVGYFCAFSNAAVNPCICFIFSENFRQGFKVLLGKMGILRRKGIAQQVTQISMTSHSRYNKAYDGQESKADD